MRECANLAGRRAHRRPLGRGRAVRGRERGIDRLAHPVISRWHHVDVGPQREPRIVVAEVGGIARMSTPLCGRAEVG